MNRRIPFVVAIAFSAALAAAVVQAQPSGPATAQGGTPSAQSAGGGAPPAPAGARDSTWGRGFGAHVSDMAVQGHPRDHQPGMFGDCVSTMAVEAMAMGDDGAMHEMCHMH